MNTHFNDFKIYGGIREIFPLSIDEIVFSMGSCGSELSPLMIIII